MAGAHTVYRTTREKRNDIVAIGGTLKLPSEYKSRANDTNYKNGAFPEFMYGFYTSGQGFDCGILCDSTDPYPGYKLFIADNGNGTLSSPWESHGAMRLATGAEIQLKVSFLNGKVRLECLGGGQTKDVLEVDFVSTSMYNKFKAGCWVNQEMVIAINADKDGYTNLLPGVYFKEAKFSKTTMTTVSGSYIALTNTNSIEYFWPDEGFPLGTTYDDTRDNTPTTIGVMENGFVSDKASATTDNVRYRV